MQARHAGMYSHASSPETGQNRAQQGHQRQRITPKNAAPRRDAIVLDDKVCLPTTRSRFLFPAENAFVFLIPGRLDAQVATVVL